MFTGIIEDLGKIVSITPSGTNLNISVEASISPELKIDQSVSHNGVCLTVIDVSGNNYTVTAIEETLSKSNLGNLKAGDFVNLERCVVANGRLDGHIVQGHVDTTANCREIENQDGSWIFRFSHAEKPNFITVEKGSITVNGVSLTVVESSPNGFSVAIIPFTYDHTNFHTLKTGDQVNIEFDIIGKYVARLLQQQR